MQTYMKMISRLWIALVLNDFSSENCKIKMRGQETKG